MMRIAITLLIVVVILNVCWNRNAIWDRANEIYWFHKAMNHVTPPGTKLVEMDPTAASNLLYENVDYVDATKYPKPPTGNLSSAKGSAQYLPIVAREIQRFAPLFTGAHDSAAVYVGKISTASGKSRLLIIRGSVELNAAHLQWFRADILIPPTVIHGTRLIPIGTRGFAMSSPANYVRMRPGVLDPNDPSHVSIPFDVTPMPFAPDIPVNKQAILDLHLRDDDTLSIAERGLTGGP